MADPTMAFRTCWKRVQMLGAMAAISGISGAQGHEREGADCCDPEGPDVQGVLPARCDFVRDRARRGLRSVKLVIFDAHEGLKLVIGEVLHATSQPRRVSAMRNLLAYSGRKVRGVVAAFIGSAFTQEDATSANLQRRQVGDL